MSLIKVNLMLNLKLLSFVTATFDFNLSLQVDNPFPFSYKIQGIYIKPGVGGQ